eukprot:SAG11_NODE_5317_length_1598_cov_1.640427_1_plen_162_part_00
MSVSSLTPIAELHAVASTPTLSACAAISAISFSCASTNFFCAWSLAVETIKPSDLRSTKPPPGAASHCSRPWVGKVGATRRKAVRKMSSLNPHGMDPSRSVCDVPELPRPYQWARKSLDWRARTCLWALSGYTSRTNSRATRNPLAREVANPSRHCLQTSA